MITKVKYTDEESNWVNITFDDNTTYPCSTTDGIRREYTDELQTWLGVGGVIEAQYTPAELNAKEIEDKKQVIKNSMNELLGDLAPAESMLLMLKYGFEKMQPSGSNDAPVPSVPLTPTGEDLVTWGDRVASELEAKVIELRQL